jgi:hypothetical protein
MADLEAMNAIAQQLYVPIVVRAHGDAGGEILRSLLVFLRELYQYVPPETVTGRVVIFKTIDSAARPVPVHQAVKSKAFEALAQNLKGPCTLQVLHNGEVFLWVGRTHDPKELASVAVVYTYEDRIERFYARNEVAVVEKVLPECASNFSISTFEDLRAALESYRTTMVRKSSCLTGC